MGYGAESRTVLSAISVSNNWLPAWRVIMRQQGQMPPEMPRHYLWQLAQGSALVKSSIQFASQLMPPSGEKDCSPWNDFSVTSENTK